MMRNKIQIMNTACDAHFGESVLNCISDLGIRVSNFEYAVFPGFCDVHVHFREPGFSYKETIRPEVNVQPGAATPQCVPCPT